MQKQHLQPCSATTAAVSCCCWALLCCSEIALYTTLCCTLLKQGSSNPSMKHEYDELAHVALR